MRTDGIDLVGDVALPDTVDAVFIDAGGVLVTPDPDRVRAMLADAAPDRWTDVDLPGDDALVEAHYRAMFAVDEARSAPETFDAYLPAYLGLLGVDDPATLDAARDLWSVPYLLWTRPLPGVVDALGSLAASGRALAVVSNADGRVAEALAGLVQVGEGPGTSLAEIVDSGVVGIHKPDPRIFEIALEAVGVAPDRAIHVGDSYGYDVEGARAAGVTPVFVDPLGLHRDPGCPVAASLTDLAARLPT